MWCGCDSVPPSQMRFKAAHLKFVRNLIMLQGQVETNIPLFQIFRLILLSNLAQLSFQITFGRSYLLDLNLQHRYLCRLCSPFYCLPLIFYPQFFTEFNLEPPSGLQRRPQRHCTSHHMDDRLQLKSHSEQVDFVAVGSCPRNCTLPTKATQCLVCADLALQICLGLNC